MPDTPNSAIIENTVIKTLLVRLSWLRGFISRFCLIKISLACLLRTKISMVFKVSLMDRPRRESSEAMITSSGSSLSSNSSTRLAFVDFLGFQSQPLQISEQVFVKLYVTGIAQAPIFTHLLDSDLLSPLFLPSMYRFHLICFPSTFLMFKSTASAISFWSSCLSFLKLSKRVLPSSICLACSTVIS